ncbi:MAG: ribonuclease HI family protein [Acidobacteria bacterium]|nr:ribonuclease HI family protein [Acidobacteriota bacterium]
MEATLFSNPESELIAYVDGASRGNPGPASYGVVIQNRHGETKEKLSKFIGRATNNVAEWNGLIAALEYAASNQAQRLKVYCDSELVARQMQGRYRVQSPDLKPLFELARKLAGMIDEFSIQHVPRERNREADLLANEALDAAARGRLSAPQPGKPSVAASQETLQVFSAIAEAGKLRPLPPLPDLQEGAEYEVRLRKRRKFGRLNRQ